MPHLKTRLPLGAAALLPLAAVMTPALSAPTGGSISPGAKAPVSHNEQGNFRTPSVDALADLPPPTSPSCPADCDGNGAVNSADVSAFLLLWLQCTASGSPEADFDSSGTVTSTDINAYLTAWTAAMVDGC